MKKRGSSHTEMILAFVIFIAAVGLALFLFSPGTGDRKINTYLTYSFTEVVRKTNVGLEVYSVDLKPEVIIEDTIGLEFPGINKSVRVDSYDGAELESSRDEGVVYFKKGSLDWTTIDFVNVKFSEDFSDGAPFTGTINETYYEISTSYEKEVLSEKRFKALVNEYNADYNSLREDFNLKIGIGFSLVFDDGYEIVAEQDIPTGLEVYSDTKRVEVLRESGEVVFADLDVWVW